MPADETQPEEQQPSEKQAGQPTKPWWLDYVGAAGVAVAFAALLLNVCNTNKQLELTRSALTLSQRAWMLPNATAWPGEFKPFKPDVQPVFRLEWKNTGGGPALDVEANMGVITRRPDNPVPDHPVYWPVRRVTKTVVGPGNVHYVNAELPKLTQEQADQLNAGTLIMTIHSYILYRDIFGTSRWTTACFDYEAQRQVLMPCPNYNDTDSEARPTFKPNIKNGRWVGDSFVPDPTPTSVR